MKKSPLAMMLAVAMLIVGGPASGQTISPCVGG